MFRAPTLPIILIAVSLPSFWMAWSSYVYCLLTDSMIVDLHRPYGDSSRVEWSTIEVLSVHGFDVTSLLPFIVLGLNVLTPFLDPLLQPVLTLELVLKDSFENRGTLCHWSLIMMLLIDWHLSPPLYWTLLSHQLLL